MNSIILSHNLCEPKLVEVIEKKGPSHPDKLADSIAEAVSLDICKYYISEYGQIPRFNTDQVTINGGKVNKYIGGGKIEQKATIRINGTASSNGDITKINDVATFACHNAIKEILGDVADELFDILPNIRAYDRWNSRIFSGAVPLSEDTTVGVGYAYFDSLESIVIGLETFLLKEICSSYPVGGDFKICAIKKPDNIYFIIGIAFIGREIRDIEDYFQKKEEIERKLEFFIARRFDKFKVIVNAGDSLDDGKAYFTLTGTSAEHDKGLTGAAGGLSGFVSTSRPRSTDLVYGKNPIYHIGKLYNHLAHELSKKLFIEHDLDTEILIVGLVGSPVDKPDCIQIAFHNDSAITNQKTLIYAVDQYIKDDLTFLDKTNITKIASCIINAVSR